MRRHTVRRTALLCALAVTVCFLSGCADKAVKTDPGNPTTLTVWHYYNGPQQSAFDEAVRQFNETVGRDEGIVISAHSMGGINDLANKLFAAANEEPGAPDMPDIFGAYGDSAFVLHQMGLVSPIDDYMTEEALSEYVPAFLEEGKIGTEHLYVFPVAKSTETILLNKTDFVRFQAAVREAPYHEAVTYDDLSTWEGVLRVSNLYYRYTDDLTPDIPADGRAFFGVDSVANYILVGMKQLGIDLVSATEEETSLSLERDALRRLYDVYFGGIASGGFTKIGNYCSDDAKTGSILAFVSSTASTRYAPEQVTLLDGRSYPIEFEALPYPVFEGGDATVISQGAGLCVTQNTPVKEYAAAVFLKWFTETERNSQFSLDSGYLPVKSAALKDESIGEVPDGAAMSTLDRLTAENLRIAVAQIGESALYYNPVFQGSVEFRLVLDASMTEEAMSAQEEVRDAVRDGEPREDALERIVSGDAFERWADSLEAALLETMAEH